jgi:DNA polymerase sigma
MEYPPLRPLYMALRVILESKSIFGAETSSISPYGLILLIAAFMKLHNERLSGKSCLGVQFLAILETYGTKVNLETTGIAVDPPGYFDFASIRQHKYSSRHNGQNPAYLRGQRALLRFKVNAGDKANHPAAKHLCIQDPANYLNDVGLLCVRTAELQGVLSDAYRRLRTAVDMWDDGYRSHDSILGQALHANFDDLERMRSRIAMP